MEIKELEQKIDSQQMINEKLLRKYVIARTEDFSSSGGIVALVLLSVFLVVLGLLGHFKFDLKWPVIIAICSAVIIALLFEIHNRFPLSKGNLAITKISDFQPTLLKYKKSNLLFYSIFTPVFIGLFVWLAFELRTIFTKDLWGLEYDARFANFVFMLVIIFTIMMLIALVVDMFTKSRAVDRLVAEIDELYI